MQSEENRLDDLIRLVALSSYIYLETYPFLLPLYNGLRCLHVIHFPRERQEALRSLEEDEHCKRFPSVYLSLIFCTFTRQLC